VGGPRAGRAGRGRGAPAAGGPGGAGGSPAPPPARGGETPGRAAADVASLARLYGTVRPGLIKIADGLNRNRNGGQNVRAVCCLPALTGPYGGRGGGRAYSTSGHPMWDAGAGPPPADCPPPGRRGDTKRPGAAPPGQAA